MISCARCVRKFHYKNAGSVLEVRKVSRGTVKGSITGIWKVSFVRNYRQEERGKGGRKRRRWKKAEKALLNRGANRAVTRSRGWSDLRVFGRRIARRAVGTRSINCKFWLGFTSGERARAHIAALSLKRKLRSSAPRSPPIGIYGHVSCKRKQEKWGGEWRGVANFALTVGGLERFATMRARARACFVS